jgi:hypothetical protein
MQHGKASRSSNKTITQSRKETGRKRPIDYFPVTAWIG